MMATSMGPNFSGHPAGMGHPGVAGHPMGPGMPHNPGQQGAPNAGIPHQFGGPMVSAPGAQVNPALMGGMPPGANPNAHALQHLNPAQQQMFQQQQLQHFGNPQAIAAMRQQQLLQHQQQARHLMAQQAFQANMQGGMPMNMAQMNLNPQQLHQLRAARMGPQHPQAQAIMAQQLALQQQQHQQQQQAAHAQQQMQGGPNPGQPMQMNAQSMQNMQQNQLAAASLQNQMANQQGQQPQGQPQPQPQSQPQQPGQQPQQTPQQSSQAGTPAPTGPQTPAQTPNSTPAQPNQMPPGHSQPQVPQTPAQSQAQPQPQPQAQPQPQPQAPTQQQQHQMNAAAQQLAIQNSMLQQQQRRDNMKGQCLLKLMQFSEHLSGYPGSKGRDDLSYWNAFVARFFSQNGVFRHSLHITDAEDTTDKQYEIAYPAIARYFHTHFGSGVKNMQLIMDKGVTDRPLPGDCHCIENSKASLVYWFETGSHLVASGTLRAQFDAEQKIELFEFLTTSHEEYISRKQVIDAAKPAHMWMKEWHKANSQDGKSPELSKKGKGRQLKSPQTQPPEVLVDLPEAAVNSKGVTQAVFQFLEIVEVMGQMNPLFGFFHSNPGLGPYQALEQYVATQINGVPPTMNGQPMPPGARTPSFGQFPMGASPATVHMNLPGSPHIGSPAPGHMQAPGMQMQHSQQGTGSSGPSANTSPASNKRRRPSAVKEEDGSGAPTPATNGMPRNAKPPTPRMTKRLKGNPPA
ncbi:LIM-domain binding protein-domain-containing protein [Fusarium solani]|uniref:LIM-domain binding protein-domain-containing protein n=1 Tax=Fusarium solani TaxID=169388 RepID=A0A9P9K3Q1_FUSSL|nr:LIM-domain binding protein-domain-containing protein [Fusarium solani]KAH7248067.1 LIM-domain binding protein-domain-containing protein [Fusarium solani]